MNSGIRESGASESIVAPPGCGASVHVHLFHDVGAQLLAQDYEGLVAVGPHFVRQGRTTGIGNGVPGFAVVSLCRRIPCTRQIGQNTPY